MLLLVVYVGLSFLNSTGGSLGTDTGAKVATLAQMSERGDFRPDVGYWAAEWDPDGDYHPLFNTARNDRDEWVNVTTLPMLLVARPLYAVGGYRLALLVPMVGAVAAAWACRAMVLRLGDERQAEFVFWMVGLASPLVVYALDLWEHSIGVGLGLWALVLLLDVALDPAISWRPFAAGALLGIASTMRTESFVIAFVLVASVGLWCLWARRWTAVLSVGVLSVVGFGLPWVLNGALERSLGGNSRAERVAGVTGSTGDLALRVREAAVTWFGVPGLGYPQSVVAGVIIVGSIVGVVLMSRSSIPRGVPLAAAVGVVCAVVVGSAGLGFVSGALITSPMAVVAVISARRLPAMQVWLVVTAFVMTVLIWRFQYTGGAGPQWGGRYILVPTMILTVVGGMQVARLERPIRTGVVLACAVVSMFGLAWMQLRTHAVDEFFANLTAMPDDVIIATNGFLVREAGAASDDRLYLSVGGRANVEGAVRVVANSGQATFAVLTMPGEEVSLGAAADIVSLVGSETIDFVGVPLELQHFRVRPAG